MMIKTRILPVITFPNSSGIATANYVASLVTVVVVLQLALLYKRRSTAMCIKDGIRLPLGPPPRWFWSNALPTVKSVLETPFSVIEADRTLSIAHTFTDLFASMVSLRQGSQVIIAIGSVQVNRSYFGDSTLSKSSSHGYDGKGGW
jgi:hypothetical protein